MPHCADPTNAGCRIIAATDSLPAAAPLPPPQLPTQPHLNPSLSMRRSRGMGVMKTWPSTCPNAFTAHSKRSWSEAEGGAPPRTSLQHQVCSRAYSQGLRPGTGGSNTQRQDEC